MESPRKKLKLTPMKDAPLAPRFTQESKFTSTPLHSEKSFTLSFSSIRSSPRASNILQTFESEVENGSDEESVRSGKPSITFNLESEENYDKYFENLGKIVYAGQVWNFYKPQKSEGDDSIYRQILIQPYRAEEVAMDCFILSERDMNRAIRNILKFCLDVSGFRHFVIPTSTLDDYDHKAIIASLSNDDVIDKEGFLKDTGRYLLMETNSQLATIFKNGIYNFVQKIVLIGFKRKMLFKNPFFDHFFTFVKCMSQSIIRSVRHIGTIFGSKMLTAIVNIFDNIDDYSGDLMDSDGQYSRSAKIREYKSEAEIRIMLLYTIFANNYQFDDPKLYLMRVEAVQEVYLWTSKNPKIFFEEYKVESKLFRLLPDSCKEVRYAALVVFHKWIENPHCLAYLAPYKEQMMVEVGKRFYDVDHNIAVKAIEFFARLYRMTDIPLDCLRNIVSLIFDKHSTIGEAACRFWKFYLHRSGADPIEILRTLAHLTRKGGDCKVELIIEGCMPTFEEIKDWDLYIRFLMKTSENMELKEVVVELFAEAARQALTGVSSKRKETPKIAPQVDISDHMKLVKTFSKLKNLLMHFKEHSKILIEVMKIFPLINKAALDGTYVQNCIDLYQTVEEIFDYLLDESTVEKTVEVIDYFCDVTVLGDRIKKRADLLVKKHSEYLIDFLQQPSQSQRSISALKVSALAAKFNITLHFTWEDLFGCWGGLDHTILSQLVVCCKWFLIWRLRNFTDQARRYKTAELQTISISFLAYCNDFTSTCFTMVQNLNGEPLQHQIYDYLTEFLIIYNKELEIPLKYNKQFSSFQLSLGENDTLETLVNYLESYVIHNNEIPLEMRRNRVVRYVDLIHNNILPMEALTNIFKYYNIYFNEYGYIIESSMNDLIESNDENNVLLIIVYTMTRVYESILLKYSALDVNTEEAKNLKRLCVQFMEYKHFKTPRKHFRTLLYFSIQYALKSEMNYGFLNFLKHFLKLITDQEDRKELLDYFKARVPKTADKNDTILFFVDKLKNLSATNAKEKARGKRLDAKSGRSTSKSSTALTGKKQHVKALPVKKKSPKKKAKNTQTKNKETISAKRKINFKKSKSVVKSDSNTEGDDLTIHDSSSDDLSNFENIHIDQ